MPTPPRSNVIHAGPNSVGLLTDDTVKWIEQERQRGLGIHRGRSLRSLLPLQFGRVLDWLTVAFAIVALVPCVFYVLLCWLCDREDWIRER